MQTKHTFNPSIQSLRGISIGLVMGYHYFHWPNQAGAIGVGLFFCISGYLITSILLFEYKEFGGINLKNFFARRIRRLLPLAYLTIILNLAIFGILKSRNFIEIDFDQLKTASLYCVFYVGNLFGYYGSNYTALPEPLMHFWSLAVEEQFYVFYPFILLFLLRRAKNVLPRFLLISIFLTLIAHSVMQLIGKTVWTLPFTYFDVLFSGCLIAVLEIFYSFIPSPRLISTARFTAMLISIYLISFKLLPTDLIGQGYTVNFLLEACLFFGFYQSKSLGNIKILNWLGKLSYSLYCLHIPILVLGNQLQLPFFLKIPIVITVTIVLAMLSNRYFESIFWKSRYGK